MLCLNPTVALRVLYNTGEGASSNLDTLNITPSILHDGLGLGRPPANSKSSLRLLYLSCRPTTAGQALNFHVRPSATRFSLVIMSQRTNPLCYLHVLLGRDSNSQTSTSLLKSKCEAE